VTKQLITLLGALITIAVIALGVMFGVVPFLTGGVAALDETARSESANAAHGERIRELEAEKERLPETEASLAALRMQIPAAPLVDQAFAIVDASASAADVEISSITRGDLTAFTPRPVPQRAGLVMAPVDPSAGAAAGSDAATTDQSAPADAAGADAATTGTATGTAPADPSALAAADRMQVSVSVSAKAPTMDAVQAFLDGIRDDARLLAIDTVTVTEAADRLDVKAEIIVFMRTDRGL